MKKLFNEAPWTYVHGIFSTFFGGAEIRRSRREHSSSVLRPESSAKEDKTEGFTLIELLVVIAIITILSGLLVNNYVGTRQRGRDALRKGDLRAIQAALEFYRSDNSIYPCLNAGANPVTASSCPPNPPVAARTYPEYLNSFTNYMSSVPKDPRGVSTSACSSTNSRYLYFHNAARSQYTLFTRLENLEDSDAKSAKPVPNGSLGSCAPSAADCQTYTITSAGPCNGMVANYWINNP